jgi:hypothetical protein
MNFYRTAMRHMPEKSTLAYSTEAMSAFCWIVYESNVFKVTGWMVEESGSILFMAKLHVRNKGYGTTISLGNS